MASSLALRGGLAARTAVAAAAAANTVAVSPSAVARRAPPVARKALSLPSTSFSSSFLGCRIARRPSAAFGNRISMPSRAITTAVKEGDTLPEGSFSYFAKDGDLKTISIEELGKGKKIVLFAVPGAFTPTCSLKHLPGFIEKADEIKAKGVETIACVSVNDPFVMEAWGKTVGTGDNVLLLADGSGIFTKALGVELDLADKGLGVRSRRYSMLVDDLKVVKLNLEEGGAFTVSGADEIIAAL